MTRIVAALAFIFCVFCLVTAQAKTLSPGEFTAEFADALRAELAASTVTVRADLELVIKSPDGKEATAFLRNAYQEYSTAPSGELANVIWF